MRRRLLQEKKLLILVLLALVVKVWSLNEARVETYYTYGFYPRFSRALRTLLGWIPFSMGDILYAIVFLYLVYNIRKFFLRLRNKETKRVLLQATVRKILRLSLYVYFVFNLFWGLNYNRQGIAHQLQLDVKKYSVQDLDTLTGAIIHRLNDYAVQVNAARRAELNNNQKLFREGLAVYEVVKHKYPYLDYNRPSVKPSFYSHIGHFFGFTGYYNPFSGEAQIKTTIPVFLKPFVLTHEIGHQLGYAKENEANFVAYLACKHAPNPEFRYSAYYDLYLYAMGELKRRDSTLAKLHKAKLHPQVVKDDKALDDYLERSANILEPIIASFYNQFLKLNNQPQGKRTYNQVVMWLIAYQKKYGVEAI